MEKANLDSWKRATQSVQLMVHRRDHNTLLRAFLLFHRLQLGFRKILMLYRCIVLMFLNVYIRRCGMILIYIKLFLFHRF